MRHKWHRGNGYWIKLLTHDWYTITDEWGNGKYKIDIWIYRTFSFKNGFMYQIRTPDVVMYDKDKWKLMCKLLRYIYRGGCPCYRRIREELINKGLWKEL